MNLADKLAFPVPGRADLKGMTLREHYAGLAMQGLVPRNGARDPEITARQSVRLADELINELESDGEQR